MNFIKLRTYTNSMSVAVVANQITALVDHYVSGVARGTTVYLSGGNEIVLQESIRNILNKIEELKQS